MKFLDLCTKKEYESKGENKVVWLKCGTLRVTDDGKQFIKNQQVRDNFAQTEAFSDLFMELATNTEAATAFVNGIIPQISK